MKFYDNSYENFHRVQNNLTDTDIIETEEFKIGHKINLKILENILFVLSITANLWGCLDPLILFLKTDVYISYTIGIINPKLNTSLDDNLT